MTRDDIINAMAYAMHHSDLAPSRAALAAIEALGVRLVPVIATEEMQLSTHACNLVPPDWDRQASRNVWWHMLHSSPLRPDEERSDEVSPRINAPA